MKNQLCDWDGNYGKDENKELWFWCIYCGQKRLLGDIHKIKCKEETFFNDNVKF